jgi:HSP20 family molecular chaperone IbpA
MRDLIPFFNDRSSLARSLGDSMDRLLNEMYSKDFFPGALAKGSYPKMNVYDDSGKLCVDAYVPELPKEKIRIDIKDHVLTIKGDSNQDRKLVTISFIAGKYRRDLLVEALGFPMA